MLVEVLRTENAKACREQALVLRSRGLPFVQSRDGREHVLLVEEAVAEVAEVELESYREENRGWPPKDLPPPAALGRFEGTFVAGALVFGLFLLQSRGAFDLDWTGRGGVRAGLVLGEEPWRAVTALTLHKGPVHLVSNLVYGAVFGFLVTLTHGGGLGWLAILVAGALGNGLNSAFHVAAGDPGHSAIGASTAVFAAVGILCGSEWRRRQLLRQRRVRRAAPILVGVLILGMYGIPQVPEDVDVFAHVGGFLCGLPVGVLLPWLLARGATGKREQVACGLAAVLLLGLSWALALASA